MGVWGDIPPITVMKQLLKKFNSCGVRGYNAARTFVQSNLAVSPATMLELSQAGRPISAQMQDANFYDGDSSPAVRLDPLDARGIDINDAWNMERDSRKKLSKAFKDSKNINKSE